MYNNNKYIAYQCIMIGYLVGKKSMLQILFLIKFDAGIPVKSATKLKTNSSAPFHFREEWRT